MTDTIKTCNTTNDKTENCNDLINPENELRDERHPLSVPKEPSVAMNDNEQINHMIQSILSSVPNNDQIPSNAQPDNEQDSVQYLLPIDFLISVNKKSNVKKIEAAIPSTFAMYPQQIMFSNPSSTPSMSATPSYPFWQSTRSELNPSAASFTPTPYSKQTITMDPIAEYPNEGKAEYIDPWNDFESNEDTQSQTDKESANESVNESMATSPQQKQSNAFKPTRKAMPYTPQTPQSTQSRAFNKNWRNRNGQTPTHTFQKVDSTQAPPVKLLAEFVEHVTLQNREECQPDTVLTKTWKMKNVGQTEWGFHVELVYCRGDKSLSLYDRYPVINAQSGQEVEISATIKTSKIPGRYCTYFRLQNKGRYFGPRVWCDIMVKSGMDTQRGKCSVSASKGKESKSNKWRNMRKKYGVVSCK